MIIESKKIREMYLREIQYSDNDNLRIWKNNNKNSFFFQDEITPLMQEKWFQSYIKNDEKMFIVVEKTDGGEHDIGCIAFRDIGDRRIDLFNVMRGNPSLCHGTIRTALQILMEYLIENYLEYEYTAKVLKTNPALNWYRKCGFEIVQEFENYNLIKYMKSDRTERTCCKGKVKIALRKITLNESPYIIKWRNNPETLKNCIDRRLLTEESNRVFFEENVASGKYIQYIVDKAAEGFEGIASYPIASVFLKNIDTINNKCELGILPSDDTDWDDVGKEMAIRALRDIAFSIYRMNKVYAHVFADVREEIEVFKKAGFVHEAYLESEVLEDEGKYRDIVRLKSFKHYNTSKNIQANCIS